MKEKEIEKMACEYARKKNVYSHKLNAIIDVGVPDRVFITHYNYAFYVEFKQRGKQLQKHQKVYIDNMRDKGFDVLVIDNFDMFKKCLDMRLKAPSNDYDYDKKDMVEENISDIHTSKYELHNRSVIGRKLFVIYKEIDY